MDNTTIIGVVVVGLGSIISLLLLIMKPIIQLNNTLNRLDNTLDRLSKDFDKHIVLSKEEFDLLDKNDMIAFTKWSEYRYACLHKDVSPVCSYVLDPAGLIYLKDNFSDRYDIHSFLIYRPIEKRIEAVGADRVARDDGKFFLPPKYYDFVITNDHDRKIKVLANVEYHVWSILQSAPPHLMTK